MNAILVATDDDALIHDALRWCAAVAGEAHVVRSVDEARRHWRGAVAVVVGGDLAADLAVGPLARRDGVVLIAEDSPAAWRRGVELGAQAVVRPRDDARAVELLAAVVDGRGEACVLSVVGAVGGVGATTIAAVLGRVAADHGSRVLLLDADPLSGGIDLVLGAEHEPGLRWAGLGQGGRLPAEGLAAALPACRGLSLLTWGRDDPSGEAPVAAVLLAAARGFDAIVADVPRHLGPIGEAVLATSVLTLVVVPEDVRGIAAARRALAAGVGAAGESALVTVAGALGPDAVAEALGLRPLMRWRTDRSIGTAVERGHGPHPNRRARRAAGALLDSVGLA